MAQIAPPRRPPGTTHLTQEVAERIAEVLGTWADELRRQDPAPRSRKT